MQEGPPIDVQIPLVWLGTEDVPILSVNQFIGQVGWSGEVFLTFGQMTPPPLLGTPEQQAEQASQVAYVPVTPVARFSLTREYLVQVIDAMQQTLVNYDQARPAERGDGA